MCKFLPFTHFYGLVIVPVLAMMLAFPASAQIFYLRYFLGHERWKGLQFDIKWHFLANLDLRAARHLLYIHVLQHYFFNNMVLLSGELYRSRWNCIFIGRRGLGNSAADKQSYS